jgi:uncharacterized membrane protein YkoI
MSAIESCRTAALGGHVARCEDCGLVSKHHPSSAQWDCQQIESFAVRQVLSMRSKLQRLGIVGIAVLSLAVPVEAHADDDNDNDLARDLYQRGEIHALSEILRMVREQAPGDVVAIDLVYLGERWIYRFQIVATDGRRVTLSVDAATATLLHNGAGN